jgi:D-sedoheptulose 7-phosphate isomerase
MMKSEIKSYLDELAELLHRIDATDSAGRRVELSASLERAIRLVHSQASENKKVMFIGNGGSASIASHYAVDFFRTGGVRAICFNDPAMLTCLSNDCGFERVFEIPVTGLADDGDILMAISSSGQSEDILRAVKAAKKKGCHIITLSGFKPDNPLRAMGEMNFYVPSESYGHVESAHSALCHCMAEAIKGLRQYAGSESEFSRLPHP